MNTQSGVGTGWVYEKGWLLTARHVVHGYNRVTIHYVDEQDEKQSISGFVRGTDELRDLAVVQVDLDLPALQSGAGLYTIDTAEPVMSLGYSSNPPVGYPNVRVGVVTTVYRTGTESVSALETDAQFDPGDSGGPVLNLQGQVIGVSQASRTSVGSKRVLGQQLVLSIREVANVWSRMKQGVQLNSPTRGHWWESK